MKPLPSSQHLNPQDSGLCTGQSHNLCTATSVCVVVVVKLASHRPKAQEATPDHVRKKDAVLSGTSV